MTNVVKSSSPQVTKHMQNNNRVPSGQLAKHPEKDGERERSAS